MTIHGDKITKKQITYWRFLLSGRIIKDGHDSKGFPPPAPSVLSMNKNNSSFTDSALCRLEEQYVVT